MANKNFNTRIQLKYDSYANWTANNPTPLSGEVCIVVIPAKSGAVVQEPSILFKVGDGTTPFNTLPYVSGIAADVYDWAKAASKPTYTAEEIDGLADYISGEIQDTNTQYKLEQDADNAHILKLSKKDIEDADWVLVTTITTADTVYDDTEVRGLIQDNTDVIGVLNSKATDEGSVKKTVSDEIAKVIAGAPESFDTLKEVSDWIATHGQDAAAMNSAILALQNILDGIGDTASGEKATVVAYVTDAIAALNIGNYALAADLTALAARVTTLEGSAHTHSNKALLDTYTQTEANLADAVLKKHDHANKTVLDGIDSAKVAAWDAAEQNAKTYADGLNTAMDTRMTAAEGAIDAVEAEVDLKANDADLAAVAKSGKIEDLAQDDYIVLNCGSSSTVI